MPPIPPTSLPPGSRWRVLALAGVGTGRRKLYRIRCACGTEAVRPLGELRSGRSLSCGCLRAEQLAARNRERAVGASPDRPKAPRRCDHCGEEYRPRKARSKYCGDRCRAGAAWAKIAADPARKKAHAARVTAAHKAETYTDHDACAHCGRPFRGPPLRLHCSRDCLDAVIRAGKYRNAHHRRRVAAEATSLAAELQRRLTDGQ